jgi:hypothetical protein
VERPKLEVANIFRRYGEAYRQQHKGSLSTAQRRVMTAIEVCRTAAFGGHLERCDSCGYERPSYDSCVMESGFYRGVRVGTRRAVYATRPCSSPLSFGLQ